MIASGLHRPESIGNCIGGVIYSCYTVAKKHSPAALEIVASLLTHGAEVQAKDKEGATALHKAAYAGNVEIVKMLIARYFAITTVFTLEFVLGVLAISVAVSMVFPRKAPLETTAR